MYSHVHDPDYGNSGYLRMTISINIWPDILSAGVEKILVFFDAGEVEKSNNDVPDYDLIFTGFMFFSQCA